MAYITATIDSSLVDSDLTNFPVGIEIDASDSILSGLSATDWQYLHATVGSVECFIEVAIWDMSSEYALIWIRVSDVSSSSDTNIKIEITSEKNDFITVSADPLVWDDFTGSDDDEADSAKWSSLETGTTFNIQSNALQASHTAAQTVSRRSLAQLSGDFDIEIDFNLITAPNTNVWAFQFQVTTGTATSNDLALIDIRYNSSKYYYTTIKIGGASYYAQTTTSDTSGKLRFLRTGSNIKIYYDNSGWVLLHDKNSFTTSDLYILLRSVTTSSMTFQASFDNLTINSCDSITGRAGETGDSAANAVWDSNFVGVYHMCQDPSASNILDSTSNSNDGTPNGSMTSGDLVDSGFGKAIDFDGSNDYINIPDDATLEVGSAYSIEAYVNVDVSQRGGIVDKLDPSLSYFGYTFIYDTNIIATGGINNRIKFITIGTGTAAWETVSGTFSLDTWYYFVMNPTEVYLNGTLNKSRSYTAVPGANNAALKLGLDYDGYYLDGIISEVRISNVTRSAAWIKATYNVLNDSLLTKVYTPDVTPPIYGVFGQISISGKNVNIIGISVLEKGQWRTVEDTYMLIDNDWRLNIKS